MHCCVQDSDEHVRSQSLLQFLKTFPSSHTSTKEKKDDNYFLFKFKLRFQIKKKNNYRMVEYYKFQYLHLDLSNQRLHKMV
jgi:hypothetical protein